jgi:hypothetical protein
MPPTHPDLDSPDPLPASSDLGDEAADLRSDGQEEATVTAIHPSSGKEREEEEEEEEKGLAAAILSAARAYGGGEGERLGRAVSAAGDGRCRPSRSGEQFQKF